MKAQNELLQRNAKRKQHVELIEKLLNQVNCIDITKFKYEEIKRIILFLIYYNDIRLLLDGIKLEYKIQDQYRLIIELKEKIQKLKYTFKIDKVILMKFGYLEVLCEIENLIESHEKIHGKIEHKLKDS